MIKFRAWEKKWKHMRKVLEINFDFDGNVTGLALSLVMAPWMKSQLFTEVDAFVLMQYTGLKDKNGKEIYEGDIVNYLFQNEENVVAPVVYHDDFAAFTIAHPKYGCLFLFGETIEEEIEVIGNIYENPELIAAEKYE